MRDVNDRSKWYSTCSDNIIQCSFTLTPNMVIFAPVQTICSHLVIIHGLIFFLVHYKML